MKFILLLITTFSFSLLSQAQNEKFDTNARIKLNPVAKFDSRGNKMKVTLINDSLFVTDKDVRIAIPNLNALDSIMKKLPQPETLTIEFESRDGDPEKIRAINAILKQCHCPVMRHSTAFDHNKRL